MSSAVGLVVRILPLKPFFYEPWDASAMVHVGVGQEEGRDLLRVEPPLPVVHCFHVLTPLEEAAVDQVFPFVFQEKTRTGDASGCSKTGDPHSDVLSSRSEIDGSQ